MESSSADSRFQQLDKLRTVYEEWLKIGKDMIPLAETSLRDLNEELDKKSAALDDVIICTSKFPCQQCSDASVFVDISLENFAFKM